MNRRERILTALNGGIPDRPPISFDSHQEPLQRLLKYYGARDKNDLYRVAGIDGFSVWDWNAVMGNYVGPAKFSPEGKALNFWGTLPQHHYALAYCKSAADLEKHVWPSVEEFDFSHVYQRALEIKAQDMAVSAGHMGVGMCIQVQLRGYELSFMDVLDDEFMTCYMEHMTDFNLKYLEALLIAGRGEIDVVRADEDMGNMETMLINPKTWRKHFKPAWKKNFDLVHRYGAKIWFHSCGCIMPVLEDLIEIGVDCWNPFPEYVKGNDHVKLKEMRKGRLVLDGGVSLFKLIQGTPQQVVNETRRVLDLFEPDGGLLIGPSQVFTNDIPTENMVAFFDTVINYKRT